MRNFRLIFLREFLTRVRSKYFWIGTFAAPFGLVLISVLPVLVMSLNTADRQYVWVVDPSDSLFSHLQSDAEVQFVRFQGTPETLRDSLVGREDVCGLILPSDFTRQNINASLSAAKPPVLATELRIQKAVREAIQNQRLRAVGISPQMLESAEFDLSMSVHKVLAEGEQETSTMLATGVGYAMAFLIYIMIAIYGSMVMKGVLEEKTNRIMEVMASSVRPFDLMLGKVAAIGAVGITQIMLWGILLVVFSLVMAPILGGAAPPPGAMPAGGMEGMSPAEMESSAGKFINELRHFDFSLLLWFPVFFVGGYLVYGSLFAALAASADQESDIQALSFVVFFPLIITMVLMGAVIESPNSGLAVFLSQFPLFSPIIMPLRMAATDVPVWQTLTSLLFLIGGVTGLIWMAARIYRIGMLMYGQKPSLKMIARWVVRGR